MTFETYQSPFTWRYGSDEMRSIWSEIRKRCLWRRIWVGIAQAQMPYGLVTPAQMDELKAHAEDVDMQRALQIEAEIHHDLMAELKTFAEQCPQAGGILHMGATSMDIEDNADVLRMREALDILLAKLKLLLEALAEKIETWADTPIMAFTHIQPAEPSTLGYRLSMYAQDLMEDYLALTAIRIQLRGKGFKGAVGTGAAYVHLVGENNFPIFEAHMSALLDLPFFPVSTQTYPRKQDYQVISALAGLGQSLYKFAFDLRLLQSPVIGEVAEPFGSKQVGSSAMPFKRNPIQSEKIDSLARVLAGMPQVAWQNAASSLLERTLDDSANRRTLLPEAFLICDELIKSMLGIVSGLDVREQIIHQNLSDYAPFAATESLLMELAKKGADRQEMHEHLRRLTLKAWQVVFEGKPNPLPEMIRNDPVILGYLPENEITVLLDASSHTGIAPQRAHWMARKIREVLD
ncbi:MAG: adenylosuccinate lyase [Chloroflexi bacterium]|nr:adenylosuccinate lyase [Chloroflexota bacterium]